MCGKCEDAGERVWRQTSRKTGLADIIEWPKSRMVSAPSPNEHISGGIRRIQACVAVNAAQGSL
jgi:hypothetical protein